MSKNKKKPETAVKRLTGAFDMPGDIIFNMPRFMILGDEEIYIENYRGIVCYSETEIKLNTTKSTVSIKGNNLSITQIASEEITIRGKIKSLEFC